MMEQELQMTSCLFGGPPVQEDIIKLGESQIGFMNIFARPLFEAVTDILPAMRFAVDEILTNKAIWESKIGDERRRKRKDHKLSLGLLSPGCSVDPSPSPRSGSPGRLFANAPSAPPAPAVPAAAAKVSSPDDAGRRGSAGSVHAVSASQRSSFASRENQSSSRRGSGDPSLTAILVTQTPNASEPHPKASSPSLEDRSKGDRKDTLTRASSKKKEKDMGRPVTAPSHARRSQGAY